LKQSMSFVFVHTDPPRVAPDWCQKTGFSRLFGVRSLCFVFQLKNKPLLLIISPVFILSALGNPHPPFGIVQVVLGDFAGGSAK